MPPQVDKAALKPHFRKSPQKFWRNLYQGLGGLKCVNQQIQPLLDFLRGKYRGLGHARAYNCDIMTQTIPPQSKKANSLIPKVFTERENFG